ncbi:GLIPR1-like protein 1 [Crassostrea virginica]
MRELKWSGELASIAQNHANKCVYAHNPSRSSQSASFAYVGENLYANTAQVSPSYAVTYWDDEKNFYNYDTNTCSAPTDMTCAHYTQNVWAETEYVGCAVAYCTPLQGFSWPSAYYYVCNYGIGGNFNGNRPYIKGSSCSQCPSGYTCNNGLCRS